MSNDSKGTASECFYDEIYYKEHFGRIVTNPEYYAVLSEFWKYSVFELNGYANPEGPILDFGSGPGQVTAAINADCFDTSPYIRDFLSKRGRTVFSDLESIPKKHYNFIMYSHALEHSMEPAIELERIRSFLKPEGTLVLILPIEAIPGEETFKQDNNKHFFVWNFQSITNLLVEKGFRVAKQKEIFGPTALHLLFPYLGSRSIPISTVLGRIKGSYHSMLTFAQAV